MQVGLNPATDLVGANVAGPASASIGDPVTITWDVSVPGSETNNADGSWHDAVYLSSDTVWDANDFRLGEVRHDGTLTPGGAGYTGTLNTTLGGVVDGDYYIIVRIDNRNEVRETPAGELNNPTASIATMTVGAWVLPLSTPDSSRTLTAKGRHFFRIPNVTAGQDLRVTLDMVDDNAATEIYLRYEALPDRGRYDYAHVGNFQADQTLIAPQYGGRQLLPVHLRRQRAGRRRLHGHRGAAAVRGDGRRRGARPATSARPPCRLPAAS